MGESFFNCRRVTQMTIIFFLIVFAFAAEGESWMGWSLGASVAILLLSVDLMFLDESHFIYEPSHEVCYVIRDLIVLLPLLEWEV